MAEPNAQPALREVIDSLKAQKQAIEKNIELIKSRNKILENIVPVDKELLIKEKETLTGIAGAMKGVTDSVNAVESSLVSGAEGFVNDIFGPGLGGLINTISIGFFTRWRDKSKEDKRQAKILKEQNEKAEELYDTRLGIMAQSAIQSREQLDNDIEAAADPAADEATKKKGEIAQENLDKIYLGEQDAESCIKQTYEPFKTNLDHKQETVDISEQRLLKDLGIHPETKRPVSVRLTKYGPTIQMGTKDDEEKPKWAALTPAQKKDIDAITMEDALRLFQLPEKIGSFEGEDVSINIGPFGPYVKCGKTNVSARDVDIFSITEEEALILVKEKRELDANREIKVFEEKGIKILNGMYGPYITNGKVNVKVPKDVEPKSLEEDTCIEMINNAPKRKRRRRRFTSKKT